MTQTETLKILAVLKGAYPAFYRGMTRKEADSVIALWSEMFADESYELVAAAVKALIACDEKGYPPHIGAVKARIRQIIAPQEMTEGEAWALILRAISRSAYNAREEFDRLPKILQGVVGSPNQLRDWALMDSNAVQSVVASNVQRSYKARATANKNYEALPNDIKALANGIANKLSLGDGNNAPD